MTNQPPQHSEDPPMPPNLVLGRLAAEANHPDPRLNGSLLPAPLAPEELVRLT